MTGRRLTRGRPVLFTDTLRNRYLEAVAAGMYLKDAAAHIGVSENVPQRHARTDRAFAAALKEARTAGKKVRIDELPHGEYRYNHHNCRCTNGCAQAATKNRAGRRRTAAETTDTGGQVIDLPPAQVPHSFSLLKAS
ncbi:hypothetical protein ACWGH4_00130 [Streptomyces sp. NPDC054847]